LGRRPAQSSPLILVVGEICHSGANLLESVGPAAPIQLPVLTQAPLNEFQE
jgi:hypothetical protein